jgi:hypothetical protein
VVLVIVTADPAQATDGEENETFNVGEDVEHKP